MTTTRWSDEEVEAVARYHLKVLEQRMTEIQADLATTDEVTRLAVIKRHSLTPDSSRTIADLQQLCDTYSIEPLAKRSTRALWLKHVEDKLTEFKLANSVGYQARKKEMRAVVREHSRVEHMLHYRQQLADTDTALTQVFTTGRIDGWACQRLSVRLAERARLEWVWYTTRIWMSNLADGMTLDQALVHAKERATHELELPGSGQYGHQFYAESVMAGTVEFIQSRGVWF